MRVLSLIVLAVSLAAAAPAAADFYKYVDAQGRIRFTDDINQVPPEQRARLARYPESRSPEPPAAKPADAAEKPAGDPTPAAASTAADPAPGVDKELQEARRRLEEMKARLEEEFRAMTQEKEALAKEKEAAKSREEIMSYNKKVEAFNLRAERYEKQGEELRRLVHEYNTRLVEEGGKSAAASK